MDDKTKQAVDGALEVIKGIDRLASNPDFRRFMDRHGRRADEIADDILHSEMEPAAREQKRNHRLGMLEILTSMKQDREAQVRFLSQHGIDPGEG